MLRLTVSLVKVALSCGRVDSRIYDTPSRRNGRGRAAGQFSPDVRSKLNFI